MEVRARGESAVSGPPRERPLATPSLSAQEGGGEVSMAAVNGPAWPPDKSEHIIETERIGEAGSSAFLLPSKMRGEEKEGAPATLFLSSVTAWGSEESTTAAPLPLEGNEL